MANEVGELRRCYGLYRGTVVSTKDPLVKRRIKVVVPAIMGETPTEWAWPVEEAGVKVAPPAVGQGVWVMFENGDPSYPLWLGVFGKVVDSNEHVLITPSTITGTYIEKARFSDGRNELDLIATLKAISDKLDDLEANKSDIGHTHAGL